MKITPLLRYPHH